MVEIQLTPLVTEHYATIFEFESDPESIHMAAFASPKESLEEFTTTWNRRLQNPENQAYTILHDNKIVGSIMCYEMAGDRCLGYWIGKPYWGQGLASAALKKFLKMETRRPLHATCVADNIGSRKVLEKSGFTFTHIEHHNAPARTEKVEEAFYRLD